MTTLQEVLYAWQNDLEFREEFKLDPESALLKKGMQVSKEDLQKILAILNFDPSKNEKLDDRTNK